MIIVNSPLMQNEIIHILESLRTPEFTFVKKRGIRLYFETNVIDPHHAAKLAKQAIKADQNTHVMFYSVHAKV